MHAFTSLIVTNIIIINPQNNVHTNPPYTVYDVLTGEVVKRLGTDESQGVIRDVSWHPTSPGKLVASSVSHSHYIHVRCIHL